MLQNKQTYSATITFGESEDGTTCYRLTEYQEQNGGWLQCLERAPITWEEYGDAETGPRVSSALGDWEMLTTSFGCRLNIEDLLERAIYEESL